MQKEILLQELRNKMNVLELSSKENFDLHLNEMKNLINMYRHEKRRGEHSVDKTWIQTQIERMHF